MVRQAAEEKFENIKKDFLEKYKSQINSLTYHKLDIERIKNDNEWIKAFYKHSNENNDKTVAMIHEVLSWRQEFEANNLLVPGKVPFPEELLKRGALFMKNEDINCIPMLHFIVKTHKKDQYPQMHVFKFIAYFFERAYKFNVDDPIVLLFDMTDAGYANLDMEMIKFVVNCLKTYYPGLIDYMIIYQMPFIFNAAWKIIKNWLPPEAVKLIKFVDKKGIKEYIQESQLFVHMGGTDDYKYTYDPKFLLCIKTPKKQLDLEQYKENKLEKQKARQAALSEKSQEIFNDPKPQQIIQSAQQIESKMSEVSAVSVLQKQASVVLEQKLEETINATVLEKSSNEKTDPESSSSTIQEFQEKSPKKSNGTLISLDPLPEKSNHENTITTTLLSISPGEELLFKVTDLKSDITEYIKLTNNTTSTSLAYKIKITSPDKFRVKPGTGIIQPSTSVQIMINFLKEYHNSSSNHRDKFLILWTQVDDKVRANELNDFWKQVTGSKANINEHKVKCIISRSNESTTNDEFTATKNTIVPSISYDSNSSLNPLNQSNDKLYSLNKHVEENKNDSVLNRSESKTKLKKIANKPDENIGFVNTASKNFASKNEKLAAKFGIVEDPATLNTNNINMKLHHIETDIADVISNQQRITKQISAIIYLVYFLILINLIQMLFQSNFFTGIIEPYIDHLLFKSP